MDTNFPQAMRLARTELRLSLAEVRQQLRARGLSVTGQALSNYERGVRTPRAELRAAIEQVLCITAATYRAAGAFSEALQKEDGSPCSGQDPDHTQ